MTDVVFDDSRLTQNDPVARMVEKTYLVARDKIDAVNKILLNQEEGTPVREIDKALKEESAKENSDLNPAVLKAAKDAEKKRVAYREAIEAARNAYRKEVLHEEEKSTSEVSDDEKEEAKNFRKAAQEAVSFLQTVAKANGNKELEDWAAALEIPQVGRQGSSTVGQTKPRVFVFIDGKDTPEDSLTKAAAAVSTTGKDGVKVTASDLAAAWHAQLGEEYGEFKAFDHTFKVVKKPNKSDAS